MTAAHESAAASTPIRVAAQIVLAIVALAAVLWTLHRLERVVLMLTLAGLFAYVIAPLVTLAEHPLRIAGRPRRLARGPAIAVVYLLLAGTVCGTAVVLLPRVSAQASEIVAGAPAYTRSVMAWEHGWSRYYERLRMPAEVRARIDQSVAAASTAAAASARAALLGIAGMIEYLPWLVLIPILGFFMLKDGATLRRLFIKALPRSGQLRSHRLFEELNATLAAYIRAQLLASVLVGVLSGVGLALIGVPYPVLLGVLAGILEFIPLVGPLILATLAAIVGAVQSPMLAVWALAYLAVLRLVEDYVIYPRLLRRHVHLHPLAVIVAVLAGAELAGVAGMFLAIPVVAVGSVAFRHWNAWPVSQEGS